MKETSGKRTGCFLPQRHQRLRPCQSSSSALSLQHLRGFGESHPGSPQVPFHAFDPSHVPARRGRGRRGTHTVCKTPGGRRPAPRAPHSPARPAAEAVPRRGPPPAPPPRSPPPLPPASCRGDLLRSRRPGAFSAPPRAAWERPASLVTIVTADPRVPRRSPRASPRPQGSRAPRVELNLGSCGYLPTKIAKSHGCFSLQRRRSSLTIPSRETETQKS